MMKFGVRVAEWLARPRRVEAGGRRKATPSGGEGGRGRRWVIHLST